MTLILSNDDIDHLLDMSACIDVMEAAFRGFAAGRAGNAGRCEILTPTARDDALYSLMNMNGVLPDLGVAAVRINSDILTWPASGDGVKRVKVPSAPNARYVGLVLLFSTTTGEPLAIYPDGIVQRMRTGATSGLAAKLLARADARKIALLGTGWQAGAQAMAIAAVRPVSEIRCYSPRDESRRNFADEMSAKLGVDIIPVSTAREAVRGADVVLCATNSMGPMLPAEWLEPGMHVSSLKRLELDASVVKTADVAVTHSRNAEAPMQIIRAAGADLARDTDRQKARLAEAIDEDAMPTLGEIVLGRAAGRGNDKEITLFLNYTGMGYQFAATGALLYRRAIEQNVGRKLDTDWFTSSAPS
ncbi:MAG TPA: ornithine cyclodeaminase family protein [Beijerinckiaceae bacterium]|nr:ornithine cyclodeaminase family protein [Beijerinckiaceae bacterium]